MPLAKQVIISSTEGINSATNIDHHLTNNNATTIDNAAKHNIGTTTTSNSLRLTDGNITDIVSTYNVTLHPLHFVENGCIVPADEWYDSYFGVKLAVPEWEAILTAILLSIIIVLTIVGNILVILSVFTYKPLRIVQNFFIVSLAVADLTVALLVLPFNVAYSILGRWNFGIYLCKMWLTCDIMCCTSSILNLCAIALDRYWAITDPINYAQKRTVGRVLLLIAGVWILSLLISSPPLVGWNDWPEEFFSATPCELNSDPGYVIYSSLGSFFIPLIIMATVYIEIFVATRRRLRERAQAAKINTITIRSAGEDVATTTLNSDSGESRTGFISTLCYNFFCCCSSTSHFSSTPIVQNDQESICSETNVNNDNSRCQVKEHRVVVVTQRKKTRRAKIKDSIKHGKFKACKTQQSTNTRLNPTKLIDGGGAGSSLLCIAIDEENQEVSTESGSDPKCCLQVCDEDGSKVLTGDNDEENMSLKRTPPQSSVATVVTQAEPLQKKTDGVYQFIEEKQKISLSKERRAARTLGIIMGVFVLCWLPFFLMYVVLPFCSTCCPTKKFKNFITWLGYINSVLNPIIYTIFNLDYRRAFKRLLGFN